MVEKTKEFCEEVCVNKEEYNYLMTTYGKECLNCPVDGFVDYLNAGVE